MAKEYLPAGVKSKGDMPQWAYEAFQKEMQKRKAEGVPVDENQFLKLEARKFYKEKDYEKALYYYGKILDSSDANYKDVWLLRYAFQCCVALGKEEEGLGLWEKAAALHPDYYRINIFRAESLLEISRTDDAVKLYEYGLTTWPEEPRVYYDYIFDHLAYKGDHERAKVLLRKVNALHEEKDVGLLYHLAKAAISIQDHDMAIELCTRRVRLHGDNPDVYLNSYSKVARHYGLKGQEPEGRRVLQEMLERVAREDFKIKFVSYASDTGAVFDELWPEKAAFWDMRVLDRLERQEGDDEATRSFHLALYRLDRRLDLSKAREYILRTLALTPDNAYANFCLAKILAEQHECGAAKAQFEKALAMDPKPHEYWLGSLDACRGR